MAKIDELRDRLVLLNGEAQTIKQRVESEKRDLTVEESDDLDRINSDFHRTKADIDRWSMSEENAQILTAPAGRKTQPDEPATLQDDGDGGVQLARPHAAANGAAAGNGATLAPNLSPRRGGIERVSARYGQPPGNWNFLSLGDFAMAVKNACIKGGQWDQRLVTSERLATSTFANEGVGAEGGFAVPPDFRTEIMSMFMSDESILSRCDQVTVSGNTFTSPVDMTTPWGTGGIRAYWGAEGGVKTPSKPALQERTVKLHKLYALVPVSDELLDDAPGMNAYLRRKAPEMIEYEATKAVLVGNGVGKPLGIMESPALVSVAKNDPQTADTLTAANVLAMYSRMPSRNRSRAVWVVNQSVEPQLFKLSMPGTDNAGNTVTGWGGMVYMPANGFSGSPFATLFGRPVITSEALPALGDKGDILFADFSQYLLLLKSGINPRVDVSIHIYFDQDLTAFRFVLRVGGMPWWDAAVTAGDGVSTYGPFVTLDERGA